MPVLDVVGRPVPPTEIVRRLRQINPGFGLLFTQRYDGNWWSLTLDWEPDDPRRSRIASGELTPLDAFDVLGHLPLDCPAEQAFGYVVNTLSRMTAPRMRAMLDRVHNFNRTVTSDVAEQVLDDIMPDLLGMGGKGSRQGSTNRSYGGLQKAAHP